MKTPLLLALAFFYYIINNAYFLHVNSLNLYQIKG